MNSATLSDARKRMEEMVDVIEEWTPTTHTYKVDGKVIFSERVYPLFPFIVPPTTEEQ